MDFAVPCVLSSPLGDAESRTFFAKGSAVLTTAATVGLDHQAEVLRRYPKLFIDLVGYADWTAEAISPEDNIALGLKRSMAVRNYLVAKGIVAERITTSANSGPNLIAKADDEAALAYARFVLTKTHD